MKNFSIKMYRKKDNPGQKSYTTCPRDWVIHTVTSLVKWIILVECFTIQYGLFPLPTVASFRTTFHSSSLRYLVRTMFCRHVKPVRCQQRRMLRPLRRCASNLPKLCSLLLSLSRWWWTSPRHAHLQGLPPKLPNYGIPHANPTGLPFNYSM